MVRVDIITDIYTLIKDSQGDYYTWYYDDLETQHFETLEEAEDFIEETNTGFTEDKDTYGRAYERECRIIPVPSRR